ADFGLDFQVRKSVHVNRYELVIENKGSGMSLIQDLRDENIRAIKVDPEGDKVMRMNAQTARIEAGSVSLPRSASWLDEFRREIMFVATARPAGCHRGEARGRWNRWLLLPC